MENEPVDPRVKILCTDHIFQNDNEMQELISAMLKNQDQLIKIIRDCNLTDGIGDPITHLSFEEGQ